MSMDMNIGFAIRYAFQDEGGPPLTDAQKLDMVRLVLSYMLTYDATHEQLLEELAELREMLGPVTSEHLRQKAKE